MVSRLYWAKLKIAWGEVAGCVSGMRLSSSKSEATLQSLKDGVSSLSS